jgi:hypothetical protein
MRAGPSRSRRRSLRMRSSRRAAVRLGLWRGDAGPVDQAGFAELLVAAPPAGGGGPGDAHLVGDVGDRPSRLGGDPPDQGQSSRWVSRALAGAMRPPMSAVPEQPAPHSEAPPHVNNPYGQNT